MGRAHTVFALPVERGLCPCPSINKQHGGRRLTTICSRSAGVACGHSGMYVVFVNRKRLQEISVGTTNVATTHAHTRTTLGARYAQRAQGPDMPKRSSSTILYGSNRAAMPTRDGEGAG